MQTYFAYLLVLTLIFVNCDAFVKNKIIMNTLESFESKFASAASSLEYVMSHRNVTKLVRKSLTFKELAAKYGHPAEEYEVTTEDGYKLTVFRLPGKRMALPVLLFHGLADTSDSWVIRENTSLAITLANAQYDVWLANQRGNRYSRGHVRLSPNDPIYWKFSFHEIGIYDLSAIIDFILNKTGAAKLNAFGHSQGNTIFYALLSTRTDYNPKINVLTALAPICYLSNVQPPIGTLIKLSPLLYRLAQAIGLTNVLGDDSLQTNIFKTLSQIPVLGYVIGAGLLFWINGFDIKELEPEFFRVVGLHFPTWTSVQSLIHYAQVGLGKVFAQFDYGAIANKAIYNSSAPPVYDLGKVTAKVVLLAARNDKFSTLADVATLRRQLPNIVKYVVNPRRQMNHLDYGWGRTVSNYLYKYIFDVLETYT